MAKFLHEIAPLEAEVDGIPVHVRPLEKRDLDRARRAYAMLSEESRMNRFWEKPRELSPSRAKSLTDTDNRNHVAWFALPRDESDPIPGYGAASFWRDENKGDRAELAFTVGDQWQRRGFATLLFSILWFEGWRIGIQKFDGYCRLKNTAMAGWWESIGGEVHEGSRQFELSFELQDPKKFVEKIAFGMPGSPRRVEVAEWMREWLDTVDGEAE